MQAMLNGMEEQELMGLDASTNIETENRVGGRELAASISVEEESPLAGWAGGY
jgi:hypothetical protein